MDTMKSGPLDALNAKILQHLGDRVILKPLTQWNEAYKEFPRYVMELDRIHAYLPGWEMPKIQPKNYATGYGFLTDYLAEIFAELRRRNFQTHVSAWVDMGAMTGRNQDAVKKTAAGMLKLLHPHRTVDDVTENEIAPVVELAVEMRKRTTDQLAVVLPTEFSNVEYAYHLERTG